MRRRARQDGFALLLVFAMAAAMACILYLELPRVAFESQRAKEELLIDRGEQYIRAIKLFQVEAKKRPTSIEELERFNNRRFLRRRYRDPMTGSDEWRLIHCDANGVLTDSLVQSQEKQKLANSVLAAAIQGVGESATSTNTDTHGTNNPGLMRRASDRLTPTGLGTPDIPVEPGQGESRSGPAPGTPGVPGQPPPPGMALLPTGQPGQNQQNQPPGLYPAAPVNSQQGGQMPIQVQQIQQQGQQGQNAFGSTSAFGGSSAFGTPSSAAQPNPAAQQGRSGGPIAFGGIVGGGSGGSAQPGQPNNAALEAIRNSLMNPRPGGMPSGLGAAAGSGTVFGAGLAGVASKKDGDSIKVYKDRTNYKEWEFVFDQRAEQQKQANQVNAQQQGADQNSQGSGSSSMTPRRPGQL